MGDQTSFAKEDLNPAPFIDHTLLSPTATASEIKRLCEEARRYGMAAVCVAPTFVPLAHELLKESSVKVCTVVGFPLGFQFTSVKAYEAREVVAAGAQEIDVVVNLRWVKEGRFEFVVGETEEILASVPQTTVKVILECGYLTREEKIRSAQVLSETGVHFLKTSTGFGPGGATLEDVRLLFEATGGRVAIKAAGGIRTLAQALAFLRAGASRLGTSAGAKIVQEYLAQGEETANEVEIFVDGACLGNPGPGGYAAILRSGVHEKVITGRVRQTTNNRMELMAAIEALSALKRPSKVRIYTDSRYLLDGITKWLPKWQKNNFKTSSGKPVKNRDLWERLSELIHLHEVTWEWVEGHSGHPENERCDRLAREEARRAKEEG